VAGGGYRLGSGVYSVRSRYVPEVILECITVALCMLCYTTGTWGSNCVKGCSSCGCLCMHALVLLTVSAVAVGVAG
jgi:hypothetical protein